MGIPKQGTQQDHERKIRYLPGSVCSDSISTIILGFRVWGPHDSPRSFEEDPSSSANLLELQATFFVF